MEVSFDQKVTYARSLVAKLPKELQAAYQARIVICVDQYKPPPLVYSSPKIGETDWEEIIAAAGAERIARDCIDVLTREVEEIFRPITPEIPPEAQGALPQQSAGRNLLPVAAGVGVIGLAIALLSGAK